MKALIFFLIPFSLFSEITWGPSFQTGLDSAKEQKKPIIIDFYTDWCGYCKVLENKIFPNPIVEKELNNFITIRINGDEHPEIADKYRVSGYPTILFLDKNGAYLDRITGLPDANFMQKKLLDVYNKRNLEDDLLTQLKETPDNQNLNYRLGVYYLKTMDFEKSNNYFIKSYNSKENSTEEKTKESLFLVGILHIQLKKFSESISFWSLYIKEYPKDELGTVYFYRGVSNFQLDKKKEAKEDFLKSKTSSKDSELLEKIDYYLEQLENLEE
ncbi:MAG: thioredoxin family protein [Leptospiraceae bacterium]|nr:thioredoxin family protein [Leptospiraceae bacterium]